MTLSQADGDAVWLKEHCLGDLVSHLHSATYYMTLAKHLLTLVSDFLNETVEQSDTTQILAVEPSF